MLGNRVLFASLLLEICLIFPFRKRWSHSSCCCVGLPCDRSDRKGFLSGIIFFSSGSPGLVGDHSANCINSLRENGLNCSEVSVY